MASMVSMSEDDVAYTALLCQLLSDSSTTRNARVHSWIEHQYDFALSEFDIPLKENDAVSFACSRSPSPSPSSSLGAHRTFYSDRPDSPLLPRSSVESSSPPESCPSYDALFFPSMSFPQPLALHDMQEERERERALHFLVQEMAQWKKQSSPTTPHKSVDKPLPCPPPPSPATSASQSCSSRVMRSRSSSMRISRLPSFTSTLSSDQSQSQDIFAPPLPASVTVHEGPQNEFVSELKHSDPILLRRMDSPSLKVNEQDEQELSLLSPMQDDRDSGYPSPTFSSFSCTPSRETALTSPCVSLPTSPASATFTPCFPENIALPASPDTGHFADKPLFSGVHGGISSPTSPSRTAHPTSPTAVVSPASLSTVSSCPHTCSDPVIEHSLSASPSLNVYPASPSSSLSSPVTIEHTDDATRLRVSSHSSGDLQSRWSVATTASLTPSPSDSTPPAAFLRSRTPSRGRKDKETSKDVKTPRKRTRLISFISKLSPGRLDNSNTTDTVGSVASDDFINDSDAEEAVVKYTKTISKKSSLASLRASFSLSRTSFTSQRPPISSSTSIPPLPVSPTRTSFSVSRTSFAADNMTDGGEAIPPVPTIALSRIPSRSTMLDDLLPPIPQSASTMTSFSASQISLQAHTPPSASTSQLSLLPSPTASHSASRSSLLPRSGSFKNLPASSPVLDAPVSIHPIPSSTPSRAKSIFKLSARTKTPKNRVVSGPATPSKLPLPRTVVVSSSIPIGTRHLISKIPPPPTKFTPPSKLVSMLASQSSSQLPHPTPPNASPVFKLPPPPPPKSASQLKIVVPTPTQYFPQATHSIEELKSPLSIEEPTPLVSKLPLPSASSKISRNSTVRGFWRRT